MELNKKKSAILPFAHRMAKDIPLMKHEKTKDQRINKSKQEWASAIQEIAGIPIVGVYKYLGTCLDSKLSMKTQLESIKKKKANFLYVKLYPYLVSATADGRRDM